MDGKITPDPISPDLTKIIKVGDKIKAIYSSYWLMDEIYKFTCNISSLSDAFEISVVGGTYRRTSN